MQRKDFHRTSSVVFQNLRCGQLKVNCNWWVRRFHQTSLDNIWRHRGDGAQPGQLREREQWLSSFSKRLFIHDQAVNLLVSKCKANTMSEVSEPEFVRVCILDQELGTLVTKIYRWAVHCSDRQTIGTGDSLMTREQGLHRLLVLHVREMGVRRLLHPDQASDRWNGKYTYGYKYWIDTK